MENPLSALAIGECMVEFTQQDATLFKQAFAGDTFNTLYYLAQLSNIRCSYMTVVGTCHLSQAMRQHFIESGIDTQLVFESKTSAPGLYLVQTDEQGERSFVYYRHASAAKQLMDYIDEQMESVLYQFDLIYLSGITLAILPYEHAKRLLSLLHRYKKQTNGKVFFDNNYRPSLWPNPVLAKKLYKKAHQLADTLFVTYSDEQQLYDDATLEHTIRRYKEDVPCPVIIKNSQHPVTVLLDNTVYAFNCLTVPKVIDTTGAGDSFNAGYMAYYLDKATSLEQACHYGSSLASEVIQQRGAIMAPDRLQQFAAQYTASALSETP